jgi:HEAT repeat protein
MRKICFIATSALFAMFLLGGCASLSYRLTSGEDENIRLSALEEVKNLDDKGKAEIAGVLKEFLSNTSSSVRSRAAEVLLKLGPDAAIPVFISAFSDKNQETRVLAEEYVVKFEGKALKPLLQALNSSNKYECVHAAYALGEIKPSLPEVTKKLFDCLGAEDKYVSSAARDSIIKIGIINISDLLNALKSDNGKVRYGACFIAGKKRIANRAVVEGLIENLGFQNVIVINSAEEALAEIGATSRETVNILLEKFRISDEYMQTALMKIFGNIGGPASEAISELNIILKGTNSRLAAWAVNSLCKINPASESILKEIIWMTASSDLEKKIPAIICLGKMRVNYPQIRECLLKAFKDEVILVRDAAVKAYIEITYSSNDSGEAIGELLNSPDINIRKAAAKAAGLLFSSQQKDYSLQLTALLSDKEKTVRRAAVESLGNLGLRSAKAIPELVKLLADADLGVQFAAKESIEKIGILSKPAVDSLILFINDENLHISLPVQKALIRIGQKAILPLIEALKGSINKVKTKAAYVLGKIGIEKGSPLMKESSGALILVLKNEEAEVRAAAATGLGDIGIEYKEAIIALTEALRDPDDNVRYAAVDSLGKIGSGAKASSPFLAQMLKDKNNKVAVLARDTVIKFGNEAVPYLGEALKDENAVVRSYAVDALTKIGTTDAIDVLRIYRTVRK